jgi:hypothetical protein
MASPRICLAGAPQIPFLIQLRQFSQILLHFLPSRHTFSRGLLRSLGDHAKGIGLDRRRSSTKKAADGYRLAGATITGMSTAEASFLHTEATAAAFQYNLLHTILSTSLQKDINKLAAQGFRVSPGTMLVLQAYPTVIVEKAKPAYKLRYQYIIKETVRISSGAREVEKVQEQGYTLIGETEHGTAHLLLFEQAPAE